MEQVGAGMDLASLGWCWVTEGTNWVSRQRRVAGKLVAWLGLTQMEVGEGWADAAVHFQRRHSSPGSLPGSLVA